MSAHLDCESTIEEAEVLQGEIDRLKERQRALISGMYLRNNEGEWR